MRKNSTNKRPSASRIESLEPRVLYSADLLSGAVDTSDDWNNNNIELDKVLSALASSEFADDSLNSTASDPDNYSSYEIVFIGTGIADVDTLIADMQESDPLRHLEIVLLDSTESAIEQISSVLAERSELDAIHLFAHGDEGSINFGADTLDLTTLTAQRETLSSWSNALANDADLLIYGCNLAGSEDGIALVEQLAMLTGADVAASDDLTGAEALGGDWDLEITTGSIEVNMVLSEEARQQWTATLATFTVTNLNATGVGSLDWAIDQANINAGQPDTIIFSVSGTIAASSGYVITDELIIDGTSAPGYGGAPVITIDGSAAGADIGFNFQGDSWFSVLQGLNIHSFDAGLIEIDENDITIQDNYLGTNLSGTALGGSGVSGDIIFVDDGGTDIRIIDNVISGGNTGIRINISDGAIIQGNHIGTDAAGNSAIGNINGIVLQSGAANVLIGTDGDTINDANERNVISGNTGDGIFITGAGNDDITIAGNFIGVRADLAFTLGNGDDGIDVDPTADRLTIGGVGVGNIVAGNYDNGIAVSDSGADLLIQGNFVGTDSTGTEHWGNEGFGIVLDSSTSGSPIIGGIGAGEGNTVAYNGLDDVGGGIVVFHSNTDHVTIRGNSIYDNIGLGIDLGDDGLNIIDAGDGDNGPNNLQNFANLTSATTDGAGNVTINGDTFDLKGGTYDIDIYASSGVDDGGYGEGARYLFSDTVTDGITFSLNAAGISLNPGEYITILITAGNGDTSEFSRAVIATDVSGNSAPSDLDVTSTSSGGMVLNEDGGDAAYLVNDNFGAGLANLTALTAEVRFAFTDTSTPNTLISYQVNPAVSDDFLVAIDGAGDLVIITDGISLTTTGFDFHSLADGEQHTLSVAWDDSGQLNVYVDGSLEYSTTGYAVGSSIAMGGRLVVGQDQESNLNFRWPTSNFTGTLYDLRLFDSVRSASEIDAAFDDTLLFDEASLISNWTFESLSETGEAPDTVRGDTLNARTYSGVAWTPSSPELTLAISEDAVIGDVIGAVEGYDIDRQAQINALLAANPNLVYNAETDEFYEVLTLGDWTTAETAATGQLLNGIGGQLVVIESAHENNAVVDALNSAGATLGWIGATDQTTETDWYWRTGGADDIQFWAGNETGSNIDDLYHNWWPLDPNGDATINYAIIQNNGFWYDRDVSNTNVAVVEWDASAVLDVTEALTYTFAPGGDAGGAFIIDINTGEITVANAGLIDYESSDTMDVTVRVTDDNATFYDEVFTIEVINEGGDASIDLPVPQSGDEDVGIVFSAANGNPVTVDSGDSNDPAMTVTLSVANGTLTLATSTGISFLDGTSDGDATITIFGLESDINAALDGLSYDPTANYFGPDTLSVTTGSTATNLVGSYDFDNGSLQDESGTGNDATFAGGSADPSTGYDGERGDFLSFDGDDHIEIGGRFGDPAQITLAAWVNLDAGGTDSIVMSLGDEVVLSLDTGTGVSLRTGAVSLGDGSILAGSGWHHVAASYDNVTGDIAIYVDGILTNGATTSPGLIDWAGASQANSAIGNSFGTDIFTDNPMVGDIDDARVYDRILTASEIALLAGNQGVASGSVALTVDPVNDEQSLDVNTGRTVVEGGSVVIGTSHLSTSDIDDVDSDLIYTVSTAPTYGQLELSTSPGVAITSFTQADLVAGIVVYVHDGSEVSTDAFNILVDDGEGAVSGAVFNITVTPQNDEQTIDVNLGQTVNEGGSAGITSAVLDTNDADNTPAQVVYTVTTVPGNGQLELTTAPGVAITSFTQADIDGGLLIFVHDGSETTSDSFDFSVDDGQGTVSTGTFNLTVTPINDEQTLDVNLGQTVNEGGSVGITATELSTSDVDNTPVQIVYTVTTVPGNGQLELTTAPGVAITSFTQADIDGGLLIFIHDGSETTSDNFDFSVDDGQGTVSTGNFNLTVTPINDEQTLDVNLGQTVNEGSSVGITSAVLDTNDVDNTPTQVVYTVTTLPSNGQLELTTAPGVAITSFTQADIDGGLLIFIHDGSETTSDSFDFSVDDGQGTVSTGTFNLTVTPINDEQTLDVNLGQTVNEGSSVGITSAVLDTNDVDNTPVQIVYTVTTVPGNGQLELTTAPGVAITSFTQADIDGGLLIFIHDGSETTSDSFDFSVDDGQGTVSTGTFNLTVTPINDEQTLDVNLGQTVNEGSSVGITSAVLDTNDVDNTPVQIVYTVTTVPGNGQLELTTAPGVAITSFTQADIDGGLLIFVHDGSETTSDNFDFSVDDGQGTVSTGTFNLTVTPVNDEQTLDVNLGQTVNEGGSVGITATELSTSDVDNTPVQIVYTVTTVPGNGQLELTTAPGVAITSFTQADIDGGLLIFVHDGSETTSDSFDFSVDDGQGTVSTGTFNLTVTPINDEQTLDVNLGQTVNEGGSVGITATELSTSDVDNTPVQIVYTVTTVPGNGQLELTTAPGVAITSFTQADIDGGLLIFIHDGSETTSDNFDFSVDDGQGTVSTGTFNLTVTPINDEQTLDVNLGQTVNEGSSVGITSAVLDTNDVDNTPVQIVYTVTTVPGNGQLELTTAPGVAITSFTQADIDGGLLIFVHDGSEPSSDSFDFSVDDGQGTVSTGTFSLTVNPVNDEQTLDVNLGQTVNEGGSVAITAAVLDTNDVDNTPAQIVYTVTAVPLNGQLELTTAPGVAVTSFTQADIDGSLLIFVHDGSETTSDSFGFSVDDGQGTSSTGTFNLTVTPVNNEQSLDVNLGQTVNEGDSVGITATELSTSDVDNTPVQIVYTVTTTPGNGQLELTTAPGVAVTSFTQADIDGGLLIFVHDGSETTSDSFDFSVDDGQGTVSTGTFNLTVTPVNDEQTIDVNLGQTVNEGSSVGITSAVLDTNDADNTPAQVVYTVTTLPSNGQIELTTAPGVAVTSFTQADIDGGLLIFIHDGSETTSDSFNFSVDDGQGTTSTGTFNLTVTPVNDEQTLDVNLGQTVNEGSSVGISATELSTGDVDNAPAQIVYTVTATPTSGQLELTTAAGVAITSFTQADIDGGLLIFVHDGSETTSDSFDFSVDDGQGTVSTGTFNVTVTPVNDEQTLDVNLGQTVNEGSSVGISATELSTGDVDNAPAQIVYTVTATPTSGQLELTTAAGVAITSFTQADIDGGLLIFVHDGSETTSDSFDFSVDDGQGTVSTGTFNLTVTPVNDEQTIDVNLGQTVNEGSSVGITSTVLDTNDADNTPAQVVYTVTTTPGNGQLELTTAPGVAITSFTQADIDGGLLIFVHDGSETTSDSFNFSVDDGQGTVSTGTFNLTVTPVNDEQTLDVNLGQTVNEGGSVGITSAVLDTNDADNTPVQVVYTVTTVPGNGQLELTTAPGVAITSFTQADIDGGLLIFVHDGSETTSDNFDFSVDDGQGTTSNGTFNLTVTPVNDEQSLDVNLGQTVNEGDSVGITATELSTSDVDNTPVQIVYTVTTTPGNGQLELTTASGVAITSFTQADIDGGLLIFVHDGSETTSDSFNFSVDDGQGTVSTGTFNVTVTPVNDEQTLDVNLGQTVDEGGSTAITSAVLDTNDIDNTPAQIVYTLTSIPGNGQLELTTAPGIAVTSFTQADIDGGLLIFVHDGSETTSDNFDFSVDDGQGTVSTGTFNLTVTPVNDEQTLDVNLGQTVNEGGSVGITSAVLDTNDADNTPVQVVYTVTATPTSGQLELTTAAGVAITSFTQADIDGGLLVFVHDGSETTFDSFDFSVDDGSGLVSSGTFALTVSGTNDEQTLDVNTGLTLNEGGVSTITAAQLAASDSDNSSIQLIYTITTAPANGQLELTTAPGLAISSFTQADIDAGLVIFAHDGSETAGDSFDFVLDDGQGSVDSGTFVVTIIPVNDEQQLVTANDVTVLEGGVSHITASTLTSSDSDNTPAELSYTLNSAPVTGQFEIDGTPGVAITSFTQADIDSGIVVFVHDGSETTGEQIDFSIDDGVGSVTPGSFNIVVAAVNDTPTIDPPLSPLQAFEQTVLELHTRGLQISDVDAAGSLLTVSLSVPDGNITVSALSSGPNQSGISQILGNGTAVVTIDGTLDAINELLGGNNGGRVDYINTSDTPASQVDLTIVVDDHNNGGLPSITGSQAVSSLPIQVQAVDDAPVIVSYGSASSVLLAAIENTDVVAQLTSSDVDTIDSNLVYSIVGGDDATRFEVDQNGQVSFITAPRYDLPVDSNGDNIYVVLVAVSDGTTSTAQELVVSVQQASAPVFVDNPFLNEISTIEVTAEPLSDPEPADVIDDTELAEVLTSVSRLPTDNSEPDNQNSLSNLAPPASIVIDGSVVDSISPSPAIDDPTKILPDSTSSLIRKLLLSGAQGPAKISIDLTTAIYQNSFGNDDFLQGLDRMRAHLDEAIDQDDQDAEVIASVAVGATATLTVGIIGWLLRAGSLLAGLLSSAPLWRNFDPFALFYKRENDEEDQQSETAPTNEDRKLDHLFRGGSGGTQ